ncbi:MAG: hypothetical protein AMXMBFR61_05750 [Fimbriimonadales bacterium]
MWGHQEGSHNGTAWGLPGDSRITPEQACAYMGVPNLIMVVYGGYPTPPFEPVAKRHDHLDKVVWSIVGDAGSTRNDTNTDLDEVVSLTETHPNVVGAIIDDLFFDPKPDGSFARFSADDLARFRKSLQGARRPLDLWVVVYRQNLDQPILPHLAHADVATFWTWRAEDLTTLAESFARFETSAPDMRKVLGCYMWDYGTNTPMSLEHMQQQCELGIEWLRSGRIEGMVFLATCICDLNLKAVEWTRRWIARVGDDVLPA